MVMTGSIRWTLAVCAFVITQVAVAQQPAPVKRPNVLLIVADDMNWDSPGCFGGTVNGITPNIDRLAEEGMRFWHAYVNVAVCTPSRSVMLTGLYPQNSGVKGFQNIRPGTPTLSSILNQAGYLCGTIGKPLGQQELFRWGVTYRWQGAGDEDRWGRNPAVYRRFTKSFLEAANSSGQPFFLMASSHDPHRPFASGGTKGIRAQRPHIERGDPSGQFNPEEVTVPGFLPDLPEIRREIADYSSSVRRFDDTVGAILGELRRADREKDTIVVLLSDHGMPFPFAKSNCYLNSNRTPLIVRWPGRVKPSRIDRDHMVAAIDLAPTILEAIGVPANKWNTLGSGPARFDGRSFLALLEGRTQQGRDHVFTQFDHIHGRRPYPMRCVLTKEMAYIFNPWSDGNRIYHAEPLSGQTFRAMQNAGEQDEEIAKRVGHLQRRTVEECYDLRVDPNCRTNVVNDPAYRERLDNLRERLRLWLTATKDPALQALLRRDDPVALQKYMALYLEQAKLEMEERKVYEQGTRYRF